MSHWKDAEAAGSRGPGREAVVYLSALACGRKHRGRGEGSAMVRSVLVLGAERKLSVACEVSSAKLAKWYSKLGFVEVSRMTLPNGCLVRRLEASQSGNQSGERGGRVR